ncbi:hypothetical protein D3C75_1173750 [compost metagenome]
MLLVLMLLDVRSICIGALAFCAAQQKGCTFSGENSVKRVNWIGSRVTKRSV